MLAEAITVPFATKPEAEYVDMHTWIAEQLQFRDAVDMDSETIVWRGSISPDRGILMETEINFDALTQCREPVDVD